LSSIKIQSLVPMSQGSMTMDTIKGLIEQMNN
jgi:hypothetical protein